MNTRAKVGLVAAGLARAGLFLGYRVLVGPARGQLERLRAELELERDVSLPWTLTT